MPFRNRLGLAAGFDKEAVALAAWAELGFGFVEVGTVTARAQGGNARPRLFRLPADRALINRMGFNNPGADVVAARIATVRPHLPKDFRVGVSIGRQADTTVGGEVDDYVAAYRAVAGVADYVVANVSSPNTRGLRELERPDRIAEVVAALDATPVGDRRPPLLVKLSPDVEPGELTAIVRRLVDTPAAGVLLTNTTTDRSLLRTGDRLTREPGGLSGPPLFGRMLRSVALARETAGDGLTVIASGGIGSGRRARAALAAGASLVQVYTALVYRGPDLIAQLLAALAD